MILYRKTNQLRIRRASVPEPPYWYASAVAPYSSRRALPVAIDYLHLAASCAERIEVVVCDRAGDELERATEHHPLRPPVLIEACEFAEEIFRRGEEALSFCRDRGVPALHLTSTRGTLPAQIGNGNVLAISAWPLEFERLGEMCKRAGKLEAKWGLIIPIVYPVTTALQPLADLALLARQHGAAFLTGMSLEIDPTAKHAIARSLALEGEDEIYAMLFHADLEPVHTATERHIAALAAAAGLEDFVIPPQWDARSNWNAAIVLSLAASRLLAMSEETELAGSLARSARVIAELDKPLVRIAETASLSIIEGVDEVSLDILGDWLERGRSAYVDRVNERWRLRRDYGVGSG